MSKSSRRLTALALSAVAAALLLLPAAGQAATIFGSQLKNEPTENSCDIGRHLHDRRPDPLEPARRRPLLGGRAGQRRDHQVQDQRLRRRRSRADHLPGRQPHPAEPDGPRKRPRHLGRDRADGHDPADRSAGIADHRGDRPASGQTGSAAGRRHHQIDRHHLQLERRQAQLHVRAAAGRRRRPARLDRSPERTPGPGDDRARRRQRRVRRRDPGPVPDPENDPGRLRHGAARGQRAQGRQREGLLQPRRGRDRQPQDREEVEGPQGREKMRQADAGQQGQKSL